MELQEQKDVTLPMGDQGLSKQPLRGYALFKSNMKDFIDRFDWRRLPFLTLSLVGFMFYLDYNIEKEDMSWDMMIYSPCKLHQHWRYLTYSFIHYSWSHLMGNVAQFLFFGAPLEFFYKWWRMGLIYFFGAVTAALFKIIASPDSNTTGASGANAALKMACMVVLVLKWNNDLYHLAFCLAWCFAALPNIFTDIKLTLFRGPDSESPVGTHLGHISGWFPGLILAMFLFHDKHSRWQLIIARFAMSLFVVVITGLYICNMFFSKKFQNEYTQAYCEHFYG